MIVDSIDQLIGKTPLLRLDPSIHGLKHIDVYLKLENLNPFGSVKDRVGYALLESHIPEIKKQGKTVVEASSGNTGKALAALCAIHGIPFVSYTNRIKVAEQRMILQVLGARIEELPGLSDCPDPNDPNDPTKLCSDLAIHHPDKYFYTDQYFNQENVVTHYKTTGKEIADDIPQVDYLVGPLGTCGSTLGVGTYLRECYPGLTVLGAVTKPGSWIPGARNTNELWEVGLYQESFYSAIRAATTQESINAMLELIKGAGVLCGISTGLSYHTLREYLRPIDACLTDNEPRKTAVMLVSDRLEPYMTFLKKHRPELFATSTTSRKTVFSQSEEEVERAKFVTATELEEWTIGEAQRPLVIDIRAFYAFSLGHIPGATNIRDELFATMLEEGPPFCKDQRIVVVCAIGEVSRKFAAFLTTQGYDAYSLFGGMNAYKAARHQLEKTVNMNTSHGLSS